jgi:hypothetical protein
VRNGLEHRRRQRVDVGLARQPAIDVLEAPGSLLQRERRLVATDLGQCEPGLHELEVRRKTVVRAVRARGVEQAPRGVEGPGLEVGSSCADRAAGPEACVGSQLGRARQEGRPSREAAPGVRLRCGRFERGCHAVVGGAGGAGSVPGPPVRVGVGIRRRRERAVCPRSLVRGARAVGDVPDERVSEQDAAVDLQEAGFDGWRDSVDGRAQHLRRPAEQERVSERFGGREHDQQSRLRGQGLHALRPTTPQRRWYLLSVGHGEATDQLGRPQVAGSPRSTRGFPRHSTTIRSATDPSSGPGSLSSSSRRASATASPVTRIAGSCCSGSPSAVGREAQRSATRSALNRRARYDRALADAGSSQCASSTTQANG